MGCGFVLMYFLLLLSLSLLLSLLLFQLSFLALSLKNFNMQWNFDVGFFVTIWVAAIMFKSNDILKKQTALKVPYLFFHFFWK